MTQVTEDSVRTFPLSSAAECVIRIPGEVQLEQIEHEAVLAVPQQHLHHDGQALTQRPGNEKKRESEGEWMMRQQDARSKYQGRRIALSVPAGRCRGTGARSCAWAPAPSQALPRPLSRPRPRPWPRPAPSRRPPQVPRHRPQPSRRRRRPVVFRTASRPRPPRRCAAPAQTPRSTGLPWGEKGPQRRWGMPVPVPVWERRAGERARRGRSGRRTRRPMRPAHLWRLLRPPPL